MSRTLDKWIAGNVFAFDVGDPGIIYKLPHYSTDITDAWKVIERLKGNLRTIEVYNSGYSCLIAKSEDCCIETEIADTAPLAICRAAYLLKTGESWEE
jgi:hypothetical protein